MAEEDGLLFVRLTVRLAIGAPFADCYQAGITDVQILDKGILTEMEGFPGCENADCTLCFGKDILRCARQHTDGRAKVKYHTPL